MTKRLAALLLALLPTASFAAGELVLEAASINLGDRASLQRGAALYMNYCSGCHALGFQRYARIAEDLGLSEEQVQANLMFTDAKFGEVVATAMAPADGTTWFGKAPPDLSLVARAKAGGPDWVYSFLKGFYLDESRPMGWNNTVLPNASMPNVLWQLQGPRRPVYAEAEHGGMTRIASLEPVGEGMLSEREFDQVVRDITNFLAYVSEPSALKRSSLGVFVILFLAAFTFLAWLLKKEYWRDVH